MAAQQIHPNMPPGDVYGGDEVSALILDPGYSDTRAGFAGEDVPKSVHPTYYGISSTSNRTPKYLFGDNALHTAIHGCEIENPMSKDGVVEDWDIATQLWEYAITSRLTSFKPSNPITNGLNDPSDDIKVEMEGLDDNEKPMEEHPLLLTETAWNPIKNREKAIEIAMESWGCPAFWLARQGVLASFAAGRATALVIDVGATNISVTPIHDGLILKKGVQRSPLAGNWISSQIRTLFGSVEPKVDLIPHYMVVSKIAVDANAPASAIYRKFDPSKPQSTQSFRAFEEERVLQEFKESVVQTWVGPGRLGSSNVQGGTHEDWIRTQPGRPFEMPDGTNQLWGVDRYRVAESLFDEKAAIPPNSFSTYTDIPQRSNTIPELVKNAINAVDMDLRAHLLSNIVVTGGTTLIQGFSERLNSELMAMFPGPKIRIQAAGLSSERRFGSWIGGSILGSLGTFHQMWVSRKEYEEFGSGVVEKRCK